MSNTDKWSALSTKDKADLIKLMVKNGVTSLNDMKLYYNGGPLEEANIFWPGGWLPAGSIIGNIGRIGEAAGEMLANKKFAKKAVNWYKEHAEKIPDKVHKIVYDTLKDTGFSGNMSDIVHNVRHNIKNEVNDDNVFLMPQNRQQKALEKLGYRKVEEPDYGLVNAAVQKYKEVTGREVPMYQKGEDEITREELIPLDNVDLYGPTGSFREIITPLGTSGAETKVITNNENIGDTANTPTRYYRDKNGNIYVKSWDFFDHGNYSRTDYNDEVRGGYVTRALTDMSQEFGNLLDEAGNPFVKTTGYKKVYPPEEPIINGDVENETVRERLKRYNDNKNLMATGLITAILGYDTFGGKYNYDADNAIKDILEGQYDIKKYGGNLLGGGGPLGDRDTLSHPKYNAQQESVIWDYLTSRGLNDAQAAGLMGNIAVESLLNSNINQFNGPAYGFIQAEGTRKKALKAYQGDPYVFGSGLLPEEQKQLDYIINMGINNYTPGEWGKQGYSGARAARKAFLDSSDVNEASDIITRNYLRPSKPHTKRRRDMSEYYFNKYGHKDWDFTDSEWNLKNILKK